MSIDKHFLRRKYVEETGNSIEEPDDVEITCINYREDLYKVKCMGYMEPGDKMTTSLVDIDYLTWLENQLIEKK